MVCRSQSGKIPKMIQSASSQSGTPVSQGPRMPLVLFDGECGFCSSSMKHWIRKSEGRLDFEAFQSGAGEPYGFRADQALGALRLVEKNGEIRSGAAAVLRMMDLCSSRVGTIAWMIYKNSNSFRALTDWGYAHVASRRVMLSKITCKTSPRTGN